MPTFNNDFPVPIQTFLAKLVGSHDEVWIKAMRAAHGDKRLTEQQFADLLAEMKSAPAH